MINFRKDDIKVDEQNPFENDKLDRKKQIENLTNLLNNVEGEFVLCVNGPWGSGKTTFIKIWQYYLKNKEYSTIYFNAWENDFAEDPLIPIINEFVSNVENGEDNKLSKKFIEASKKLIKIAAPAALKLATAGIIDLEKVQGMTSESIRETITNLTNDFIDDKFKEHEKTKDVIKEFKKQLSEYVKNKIVKENQEDGENGQNIEPLNGKLIFFIDELDRCKPTFAVSLLERIKHVFGIEEVIYVISIDKEQLGKTLSCIYGNGFNVDGYFARFFDLEYILPNKSELYFEYLLNNSETIKNTNIIDYIPILKRYINLTEREAQKWNYRLELSASMLTKDEIMSGNNILLIALQIIKHQNLDFYNKIVRLDYSDEDVINFINNYFSFEKVVSKFPSNNIPIYNIGLILGILQKTLLSDKVHNLKFSEVKEATNLNTKGEKTEKEWEYLHAIKSMMDSRNREYVERKMLLNIINKIELADNFKFS